ncbi:CPBP family intramembrane glutamic endopeptidase [Pseudomarimonas arenosa]|uniref:CPBP family intramembrane metalloprotease n=1 Tax=Pseudomarimonas arenosa TaxID=2774145 RepID=A0AAW3ZI51_9GAMM|nr:CPBP family intramembrane glutamic endopeptidase [Pseudomarimonas arenosa]MBD8524620.1 CPBP family intramembrane metalloprotease [Pseudomarimonas arenosa]
MGLNALPPATRMRCFIAFIVGCVLWLAATVLSHVVPTVALGLELVGLTFAIVAAIQLVLGPLAVWLALRIPGWTLADIGLRRAHWRADAAIGFAVAAVFAVLQFGLIIPATGGAERSDVVANVAQLGHSVPGLLAFIALAWAGSLSEELFFRGFLLNVLRRLFGSGRLAIILASAFVIVFFAALHGYQGWAGMIDTSLYGGLTMTLLYLWRGGRLTACIVAHAGWNTIACIALWGWF